MILTIITIVGSRRFPTSVTPTPKKRKNPHLSTNEKMKIDPAYQF